MLDIPIEESLFICLDTETTGLDPLNGGRICEIAVLSSRGGRRAGSLCTLINPQVVMTPQVINIHGITNEMVAKSPLFEHIAPALIDIINDGVLVCHNADFDISFLKNEFENIGLKMPRRVILDTLKFARCHGNFSKNRLGVIARELGISNEGWHRAAADAIMTEKIFYYFLNKFKYIGAKTIGDLYSLQTKKITQGEFLYE
ncbi:MAG: 3'-5' exonuclease [Elusimicrobiota bacterium]|jgi:DNA polymerase III epsilon subunit family exonuclease|nr:3'-5' exonuclease [Elusimicrobiota bacterium]